MYRIEIRGNGIYRGYVFKISNSLIPEFLTIEFYDYWSAYDAAEQLIKERIG